MTEIRVEIPLLGSDGTVGGPGGSPLNSAGVAAALPATVALGASAFLNYFVLPASSGGSDSNSGLSWGTAFATFDHALSTIKDAGGGVVRLGPGVHTLIDPGGAGPYTLGANNLTIIGVPGQTLLQCPYQLEDGFAVGTDAYTESGNQYIEWYARDVIFDCNGGGGFLIGAVAGWALQDVVLINAGLGSGGASFALALGGDLLPCQYGRIHNLTIDWTNPTSGGFAIAPVNVDDVLIDGFLVIGPDPIADSSLWLNAGAIDCETNTQTDCLRNLRIKNGTFVNVGTVALNSGALADPNRFTGFEYTNNAHIDSDGGYCKIGGAKVEENTWTWTRVNSSGALVYPAGYAPNGVMIFGRDADYSLPADGMIIRNNKARNMNQGSSAFILQGTSHCVVSGNESIDTRIPSKTNYIVEEQLSQAPTVISGFSAGTPSTLTIPMSAGVGQQANGGSLVAVTSTNVTVSGASAYDRVDVIVADDSTFALRAVKGQEPSFGLPPAADITSGNDAIPLWLVYVAANVTSLTSANLTDVRPFQTGHNTINQPTPSIPPGLGTTRTLASTSRRIARNRPSSADAYTIEALSYNPLLYLPMLETSGSIADDLGLNDEPGHYVGGVLLNTLATTGIYGAEFDGSTSYVQVTRPMSMLSSALCLAPFTMMAQIQPKNFSGTYTVACQGLSSANDFTWVVGGANNSYFTIGSAGAVQSSDTMSDTVMQHVAIDYDGTHLQYYLNGSTDGTSNTVGAVTYTFNSTYSYFPVVLAGNTNGAVVPPSGNYPGFIRHFGIYTPNLGGTAIAAIAAKF